MKLTAIKAQVKNEQRVSIFLDGQYSFSLTLDQLLEQKLKKGDELDEGQVKELKKLSDEGKLKARAIEWLLNRPHSTREFRDYLFKKQAEKDLIEAWIIEFTDKKYLDDEVFARWFTENRQRKNKSTRAITSELYGKGIAKNVIEKVLDERDGSDDNALEALLKKVANKPRYQDRQKLTAYLVSRGFSYGQIKDTLARWDASR